MLLTWYVRFLLPIRDDLAWRRANQEPLEMHERLTLGLLDRVLDGLVPGPAPLPVGIQKILASRANTGRMR
jgi:hypothetical protein